MTQEDIEYGALLQRAQQAADLPALPDPDAEIVDAPVDTWTPAKPGDTPGQADPEVTVEDPAAGVSLTDGGAIPDPDPDQPDPASWQFVSHEVAVDGDGNEDHTITVEPVYPAATPETRSPSGHGAAILNPSPLVRTKAAEYLNQGLPDLPPDPIGDAS